MSRISRLLSLFALLGMVSLRAAAQGPATGTPALGSFGGDPDIINLANLNSHITIPVLHKPGRGNDFIYDLSYDSSVWSPVTSGGTSWQPIQNFGWRASLEAGFGYIQRILLAPTPCPAPNQGNIATNFAWFYKDSKGISHSFGTTREVDVPCGSLTTTSLSSVVATDGSGYTFSATGSIRQGLFSSAGQAIGVPVNTPGSGSATLTDRNGNQITVNSSGQFFDTLSATTPVLTVTGSGTSASPMIFSYTAPSGASAQYKVNYTNYTIGTNFGVSGISEYKSSAGVPLVSSIVLPDGSQYGFAYEATPSTPSVGACTPYSGTTCTTARLASITLPTGGQIRYSYTGGNNGIFGDGTAATLTRTTPDGQWIYAQTKGAGSATTTTITDPQNNQTAIQFQGIYETQRTVYSGSSTLLQTVNTCYNGAASPCTGTAINLPITQRTIIANAPSSTLQSKHVDNWNMYGLATEIDDYDFGPGAPGSLLRKTLITYALLGNNINAASLMVTVCAPGGTASACNGSGTIVSQTTNTYDQTTPSAPTGVTPQHTTVSGSRGNLTTATYSTSGSSTISQVFTYYDTGLVKTATDVNGAATSYNYPDATSTCGNAFPTSVSEPLSLSRSMTWNCTGGVQATSADENNQPVTTTWNDPYFWRPASATDALNNVTTFGYLPNFQGFASTLLFNGNQSMANTGNGLDSLGRLIQVSHQQAPGTSMWDQVTQSYDSNGRPWKTSVPCVTTGAWTCPNTATTTTYDVLNRPLLITDGGGGTVSYSYSQNDVLVTVGQVGPPPTGENNKLRQLEYDALGRLTSVCEITSATGSGTCGQSTTKIGFWTKYTYDALGNLTGVTQNAQGTAQTRSYSYDLLSRLTSETNPESGTTAYSWDSATGTSCTATSSGDMIKRVDANGNWTCYNYDALHRVTDVGNNNQSASNPCKRFRYDNTSGWPGSTMPSGIVNTLGRLREAATDACSTSDPIITDEWFSYTARGEVSDVYESTPHSGGYYHTTATYWANGAPNQLTAPGGYGVSYNLDGEGRVYSTPPSVGILNATTYNAASQPTQITYASLDSDTFTYDPNTNRMTQYKFNVNGQSVVGNLTWNPNGTQASLAITDPFNSANAQTCSYSHDDLTRIASVNCGASKWQQNFSYDSFGNITKTVPTGGTGYSFQPTYSPATNRMTSIGGSTPSYDASGNVLSDFLHSYAWDAYSRPITIDGVSVTYDALGRMVEENKSGTYSQFVYAPTAAKLEIMNGQTFVKSFVPLPGGALAVGGGGIVYYRHPDHLGSSRFASTSARTMYYDGAYAPFGEPYVQQGSTDLSFTGMNQDTVTGLYDFPEREYSLQGRWPSPDPAGLDAVDPTNPQSWNRYAYVLDDPLGLVDPLGLFGNVPDGCVVTYPTPGGAGVLTCASGGAAGGAGVKNTIVQAFLESGGGGILSSIWNAIKKIPIPCGSGAFVYGGVRTSTGVASVSVNPKMLGIDSNSGTYSGTFTDITVGEAVQGGYGYATFKGGGAEHFLFGGVGGDILVAKGSVSGFSSRTEGTPLTSFSRGINLDLSLGRSGGGVGLYENFEAASTCFQNKPSKP
jgi:RHS repeat-associated protein